MAPITNNYNILNKIVVLLPNICSALFVFVLFNLQYRTHGIKKFKWRSKQMKAVTGTISIFCHTHNLIVNKCSRPKSY